MLRTPKRGQKALGRVPLILVGGLSASLAAVALFGKISEEILEREALALDTRIIELTRETRSTGLDRVMSAITATGEPWALALVSGLVGARWLSEHRTADSVTLLLATGGSGLLNQVLKTFFQRPRPTLKLRRAHASGYSYPSGHAMMTLVTYGTLAHLVRRRGVLTGHDRASLLWVPVLVLSGLVGFSRVYLEVHYPTDVLGGWAVGTILVTTFGIARAFMEPEER